VRVDEAAIQVYAAGLPEASSLPSPDPAVHVTAGSPEYRAAFFLTLDAINFGSGWFPTLRKREGRSGYYTVAMGLRDRFAANGAWSAAQLSEITAGEIAEVLSQDPDHELMQLFAGSLNDLGRRIEADYDGHFLGPVEAASGSAVALATELASWDCFRDVSTYQGFEVPLFKRAQIAAADLHSAGAADFDDLDRLTLFADNLVPHVLRLDGILHFDPDMVRRIEAGELLEHGSAEEVEMRCGAIHAAELIARHRPDLDERQIDNLLWHRGGGRQYKAVPRPRCRCTAY
jgi:hypothetical protein